MRSENQAFWDSHSRARRAPNRSAETIASYLKALRELDRYGQVDLSRADIAKYLSTRLTEISATAVAIRFAHCGLSIAGWSWKRSASPRWLGCGSPPWRTTRLLY
jgi:hypothetical protein